ncbi:hypothetical protein GCM10009119_14870 [Algoriphagus jejuensis]|uniref:PKD domain-containing protein n=1 Tax=Algoriphagus jejuensis TaxID=419934 RepID=A0ABN1MZ43_9BACT
MAAKLKQRVALFLLFIGLTIGSLTIFGAERNWDSLTHLVLFSKNLAAPSADFTFSPDGDCANVPIKFTNASSGTDLTYEWDFGDGTKSTLKDPSHTFNSAVGSGTKNFTVTLKATDKENVTATATKTVSVKEIPSLIVNSDQEVTTFENLQFYIVCEKQPVEFTFYNGKNTSENNINYQINWGDGSPIFEGADWTTLKHTYKVGIYNVTYTATSANGCTVSRKFGVFVGSNPAVGISNPGNTNVCLNQELTFPITGTENNPAGTTYTVTFSDGTPPEVFTHPPPPSVSHIFTEGSCGKYADSFQNSFSVKIVAKNPCSASQASVVPIYVSETPRPEIQLSSSTICVDETLTIGNSTDFKTEISTTGSCNDTRRFVWEISPATGWTLTSGTLGSQPNPDAPNSWTSGSESISPIFTTPGTYSIKLTTGNRCGNAEITKTVVVVPRPAPSFTLESNEVCGPATVKATNTSNILGKGSDGTYNWTVSYTNGTCGSTSDWKFDAGSDKNSENPSFIFTNPGVYTVRLSITEVCGTFRSEEKITVTAPPLVSIASVPLSCGPVTFTPKATVTACGPDAPTYKWTFEGGIPASSTSFDPGPVEFSSAGEKKISLEVTSACGTTIAERIFTVANPPKIDLGTDQEICRGQDIMLSSLVTEGSGTYTYQWTSNPISTISPPTAANITVKPDKTTVYTLTATDQTTQCKSSQQILVTVIPAPVVQFSIPDQEICSGETIQAVALTSSPIGETITWDSNAGEATGVIASGTNEIPAHAIRNTTGKQIKVVFTALIPNPSQGNCSVAPAYYTVTVNPEPVYADSKLTICSNEEIDFTPAGLIAGSSFTWTVSVPAGISGATNSSQAESSIKQQLQNNTNGPLTAIYSVAPSIGVCAGGDFTLEVTVQPSPSITFSEGDQNLCTGASSKEVRFTSDVPGATFTWTADPKGVQGVVTSGTNALIPAQSLINPTRAPITVEYKINVETTLGGSCAGVPKTYRITVNPSIAVAEEVSDFAGYQISCFGAADGAIKLNPTGGNGVFTITWTGPNGFSSNAGSIENLGPGNYQVLIADEYGCSLNKSFTINEPKNLSASLVSTTKVLCAGDETGAIRLAVAGGVDTSPYQFEWKRNGGSFPATTQDLDAIPAGTYEVIVSDANGCTSVISGIEIIEPAAAIAINFTKTDISCYGANDGSLDLDVSGGLPPYSINWSFGSTQSGFDNLGPGDYTLTVSDQSGCIRTQTITIEDAPLFAIDPEVKNVSCFGAKDGSIKLNFVGGFGATTIRWDHGAQLENLFNLTPGLYGVTVKDQTGCEIRSEYNIIEPALLAMEPQVIDALDCANPLSGEITLGISGGTPPFSIVWSNGQTNQNLTGIPAGQYSVAVTDGAGCSINKSFEVKRPAALTISAFQSTNAQCEPRVIEEKIQIAIAGGVAPYTISWSGGTISADKKTMTTTEAGYYQVTVIDGKGCSSTQSFEIQNNETIARSEIQSAAFDQYSAYLVNFEIEFWNRSFGKILAYHWDFGDGSESFEEHPKHTYEGAGDYQITLTVTDVFGCSLVVKKEVSVIDYYLIVPNVFTPNGDGINDYFFPRFVGIEGLEFWVLNKWGETIFHTNDMNSVGWDGKLNNELSTPGNYVYKLQFKTLDGRIQTKTDLFLLLK